ncbi:hypothetical protein TNCV_2649221 [Trichonephila clavipes]|nr:hypothetical protein TNCV_2649221 [Trichonephila clavipes]
MTPPKRGKFPKNIPYHDVFMGTLPSSRRGKCVTLFGGVRGPPRNSSACKQQQGRYTNYCSTKTDQFPYSLIHQSAVVESDQRVTFKSGILSAFKIEFTSRVPTQQAISSKRGTLKSLRGATLDFALTRITLTLESTIDRAKTHPAEGTKKLCKEQFQF